MRNSANIIILVVAILLGGVAAYLARDWMTNHPTVDAAAQTSTIVVAKSALPFGTMISADNVAEVSWPAGSAPDGAFTTVQDLIKDGKRVVVSPFVRNEPIVAGKVGAPNQRASLSTVITEGKRAVTVAVDDVRGVAGFIAPGDFVDVVLTRMGNNDGPQNYSEVILQHVKVLAIDQTAGEKQQERPVVAKAVTLELTPEESLKIVLATNVGRLSLMLRQSSEVALARDNKRVTDRELSGDDSAAPPAPRAQAIVVPEPVPAAAPPAEPTTRKVTIVRALKGEDYDVPRAPP